MLVHPQSAELTLELKPARDPRKTSRAGFPFDAQFPKVAV